MSADSRQLADLVRRLSRLRADMDAVRREIIAAEGQAVVTRAKLICKNEKIIDTGNLRNSFHAQTPSVGGGTASVVVANNADYASYVEYGHLTGVGRGSPETLRNRRRAAMNNGRYVRGRYVLTRAIQSTLRTQNSRISRRLQRILERYYNGGSR